MPRYIYGLAKGGLGKSDCMTSDIKATIPAHCISMSKSLEVPSHGLPNILEEASTEQEDRWLHRSFTLSKATSAEQFVV